MNEPKSRRELLEAAFDADEATREEGEAGKQTETPAQGQEYQVEAAAAKKGQETPAGQETAEGEGTPPIGKETPAPAAKVGQEGAQGRDPSQAQGGGVAAQGGGGEAAIPAPISWRGEEKAEWAKIPRKAQEAIARRELETQQVLSKSGQARQFVRDFGAVVMPHAHLIRAQGATPLAAVDNLMRTAAGLMTGNDQQKAMIVAEIVSNYAVNVDILDQALVQWRQRGFDPNHGRAVLPPQFAQALRPMHEFMQRFEEREQQLAMEREQQAEMDVETFGQGKPYFEEVRADMGDIMEVAAQRGKKMNLDQAYRAALSLHPEFQVPGNGGGNGHLNPNQISQAASTLARARKAGSSVRGAPAGGGGQGLAPPKTRREALERAWDAAAENERG